MSMSAEAPSTPCPAVDASGYQCGVEGAHEVHYRRGCWWKGSYAEARERKGHPAVRFPVERPAEART